MQKKGNDKMKKKLPVILCCVFGVIALAFGGLTAKNIIDGKDSAGEEETVYQLADTVRTAYLSEEINSLKTNKMKNAGYPEGILEKMKPAYAINKNVVGHLSIPGTELDTVIVQGADNSRYLTYNLYENWTSEVSSTNYGNIFLDYRCSKDAQISKNMVFHGHTTGKSDRIPKQAFRSLYDYRDLKHFKECPIIKYDSLYGEYTYKICAVFYSTTQPSADNGYFFNFIYPDMSDSNMVGYIEQVKQRQLYDTGVSLEPTDNIITLSTCIYDYGGSVDTRLVIVGRLLHEGEDESIDTSLVKDNPDYRRPQVWYNSKGKTNPYKDSAKWEPSPY